MTPPKVGPDVPYTFGVIGTYSVIILMLTNYKDFVNGIKKY